MASEAFREAKQADRTKRQSTCLTLYWGGCLVKTILSSYNFVTPIYRADRESFSHANILLRIRQIKKLRARYEAKSPLHTFKLPSKWGVI